MRVALLASAALLLAAPVPAAGSAPVVHLEEAYSLPAVVRAGGDGVPSSELAWCSGASPPGCFGIDLPDLPDGPHSAVVRVEDAAVAEVAFEVGPGLSPAGPTCDLDRAPARGSVVLAIPDACGGLYVRIVAPATAGKVLVDVFEGEPADLAAPSEKRAPYYGHEPVGCVADGARNVGCVVMTVPHGDAASSTIMVRIDDAATQGAAFSWAVHASGGTGCPPAGGAPCEPAGACPAELEDLAPARGWVALEIPRACDLLSVWPGEDATLGEVVLWTWA